MNRTRTFWLFVAVGYAELLVLWLIGDSTISGASAIVITCLVLLLGLGSWAAWWILAIANGVVLLTSIPILLASGGHALWGNVITLLVGSAIELALLMRPDLRRPVGQDGLQIV